MKKNFLILFLTLLAPLRSFADCPQIRGSAIVFGGRGSTTREMQQCYPDLLAFSNVEGHQDIACLAKQIDAGSFPKQTIVIAGHSSGAAEAERLAHAVKDKRRIRLVLLDGFGSPANQLGVDTTCWYARNGDLEGMNASSMKNPKACTGRLRIYDAPSCKTSLCLHLSLVNENAPADLNLGTVLATGLKNCKGNREWLD